MTLTLTQEQLDSLLQERFLGGMVLMFCLWVAARALIYVATDVRRAVREGTPLSGEAMERNRKRETQ